MAPPSQSTTAVAVAVGQWRLFFGLGLLLCLITLTFYGLQQLPPAPPNPLPASAAAYRRLFLNSSDPSFISAALRSLTSSPHLAGTPAASAAAAFVLRSLRRAGLRTTTADYGSLLSYPASAFLSAAFPNGSSLPLPPPEPAGEGVVPPYHAYSPSGAASAPAVFANLGRPADFAALRRLGVRAAGSVVVVRRGGGVPRWAAVRAAAAEGAAALLMYTEGAWGAERGTVMEGLGDPLTPGWAHTVGATTSGGGEEALGWDDERVRRRFPAIPSIPVSPATAAAILAGIGGPPAPMEWGVAPAVRVGPGPISVNFTYKEERKIAKIQNIFGIIRGQVEPDRYVLLGNHRDAWIYGAVDPSSGTAVLLDVARRLGRMLRAGWAPRRTIVLCSWDAEEFGMIGSTEWVEQNLHLLRSEAVAYLNVDCAVQGPGLFVSATPQLDPLIVEVTKQVSDPDSNDTTVYQTWTSTNNGIKIGRLGGLDSDFAPFVQHAGVPSVDIYYGKDFPVYHTVYDSYDYMKKYGDPSFHRHTAVAGIWGLLAIHLAGDEILPFDYFSYAVKLQEHTKALSIHLDSEISLHPMKNATEELVIAARKVDAEMKKLKGLINLGSIQQLELRAINDRLVLAEKSFLDSDGLKGREWFKHLVYGSPSDYNIELSIFPGILDAVYGSENLTKTEMIPAIRHEIGRVARSIRRAASSLAEDLT